MPLFESDIVNHADIYVENGIYMLSTFGISSNAVTQLWYNWQEALILDLHFCVRAVYEDFIILN